MEVALEGVRFRRHGRDVLHIPALSFAAGRTTAVLGPNGSGKTTMLRLIAAIERPDEGSITVGCLPAATLSREARKRAAFAFQQAVFVTGTVRSNLELALQLRGVDGPERVRRVYEAAAACGIAELLGRDAHSLSGGEAQRANLARALCLRAPVTLLDEPLAGVDGPARRQLLQDLPVLLREFAATAIVVIHEREEAFRLASDVVVLMGGRLRAAGPKEEVFRHPPDAETAAFLGYTLVPGERGIVGIAPGGLRVRPGDVTFEMVAEDVVDLATHREVAGTVRGVRISAPLPPGEAPVPGDHLTVSARQGDVVSFTQHGGSNT